MKNFLIIFLFFLALAFNGCISIIEKYQINRDGSGSMEYQVDLSKLQSMLKILSDTAQIDDLNMKETFQLAVPELNSLRGIQHAALNGDPENAVFGVRFDFDDMQALNQALGLLFSNEENTKQQFVEMKRKKFIRYNATSEEFSHAAMMGEGIDVDTSMMKDILAGMDYIIDIRFERKIRKIKTQANYEEPDENSLRIEANFMQMLEVEDFLKTQVKTR